MACRLHCGKWLKVFHSIIQVILVLLIYLDSVFHLSKSKRVPGDHERLLVKSKVSPRNGCGTLNRLNQSTKGARKCEKQLKTEEFYLKGKSAFEMLELSFTSKLDWNFDLLFESSFPKIVSTLTNCFFFTSSSPLGYVISLGRIFSPSSLCLREVYSLFWWFSWFFLSPFVDVIRISMPAVSFLVLCTLK